jgi:hypothetical protein
MKMCLCKIIILILSTIKCNGMEDYPCDYKELFELEAPAVDDMDHIMSSSVPEDGCSNDPTQRSFEKLGCSEDHTNLTHLTLDSQEVFPRVHRLSSTVQEIDNHPRSESTDQNPLVSSNHIVYPAFTSLPIIKNSLAYPETSTPNYRSKLLKNHKRKKPILISMEDSKKKADLSSLERSPSAIQIKHHHKAKGVGYLKYSDRPTNILISSTMDQEIETPEWFHVDQHEDRN